jgi:DNA-binding IclR family transcriptional regulator
MPRSSEMSLASASDDETIRQLGIQSLEVGGTVLQALMRQSGPCRLSDLSRDVGMPNAKLHRYLVSLIRIGLAVQDHDTGRYDLGPMALQLGLLSFSRFDLLRYAEHTLTKLVETVGESAMMVVWSPRGPSIVKTIEARHDLAVNISNGHACHLTHSASGYVFMTYGDQTALRPLVDEQLKQNKRSGLVGAPTTRAEIDAIVARTREIGVGTIDYDGHHQGSSAVSAPVLDSAGKLLLAVTVFGRHRRLDVTSDGPLVTIIRDMVAELSRNLGLRDGPYVKSATPGAE